MLNKNEIKLMENRGGQLVRRLPFTETGYIQLVADYHFGNIAANLEDKVLTVSEISPIARLMEDDYVLEQCFGPTKGDIRFELFSFTGGRLRSLGLATNLHTLSGAISENPMINRWMLQKLGSADMSVGMNAIFENASWSLPVNVRASRALLKTMLPDSDFWEGKHSVNPMGLVMSFHKLQRLYSKQTPLLHKRSAPRVINWSDALLEEKGVHYFNTNGRKGPISDFKKGQSFLKVTELAKLSVDSASPMIYPHGEVIYSLELVEFNKPEPIYIPSNAGME